MNSPIQVQIAGRIYPLRVLEEQRAEIKNAEVFIAQKLSEFRQSFDGKDAQDYLAMVMLNITVEWLKNKSDTAQFGVGLNDKLVELETELCSM